jgi:hypothetical protein
LTIAYFERAGTPGAAVYHLRTCRKPTRAIRVPLTNRQKRSGVKPRLQDRLAAARDGIAKDLDMKVEGLLHAAAS